MMSDSRTLPAPELFSVERTESTWERERRAFYAMLPSLQSTHRGGYVAVHDGKVIAEGTEKMDVARRAYDLVGNVPIYVGLATDLPESPVRMPSPRTWRRPGGNAAR